MSLLLFVLCYINLNNNSLIKREKMLEDCNYFFATLAILLVDIFSMSIYR